MQDKPGKSTLFHQLRQTYFVRRMLPTISLERKFRKFQDLGFIFGAIFLQELGVELEFVSNSRYLFFKYK